MPNIQESNRDSAGALPKACPGCCRLTPVDTALRTNFECAPCPTCGRQFVRGLLTRTRDYEEASQEDFSKFHVRERAVAGLYITETVHPAGFRIPKHSHQMVSLYLLLAGSLTEQFGREDVARQANELVFTPADRPHSNTFLGRGGRCLILELDPAADSRIAECRGLPTTLRSFRGQPAWLARRLYDEFCSGDEISPLVVEGLVLEIIGEICRQRPHCFRDRKLSQVREFLDSSFASSVSLGEISRLVHLHPVYLTRVFRQTYGCSVGEYVRRRRVDFACRQLRFSDKPLAEIASEAGFCDQAHFTRTFHQIVGVTPGQYRMARSR